MAASCWPSSIIEWCSFTMGASAPLVRLLFRCGSRLHHWLPTSPGCLCILRDEVPSLYPTTGSTFPMDVGQSVAGCAVRVIRRLDRFFEERLRTPSTRSSQNNCSRDCLETPKGLHYGVS